MAVVFQLPNERALDLVGFAWSPLFEATLSLPVIVDPKRTPLHLPWARRCRELPDDLIAEIHVLAATFSGFVPGIFEVGLCCPRPDVAEELDAFRALDDDTVAFELSLAFGGISCADPAGGAHQLDDPGFRDRVLAVAGGDDDRLELARQALDDPGALRDRYAAMLERYWELAFAEEWQRLLPRIEAEVTVGARSLVTSGVAGLVGQLLPEGRWEPASSSIVVEKEWDGSCDVAERGGLLFVPTVYGWPRVLIELGEPWPVSIIFPLRDLRQPEVPHAEDHEVAEGLRALGDETRLQIARLVAEQPRSTKELAELLALSDSAVSRHLKILQSAGVVDNERDGYFVLYRLRPERIGQLGGALRHTLGLAQAAAGGSTPALPVSLARQAG